MPANPVQKRPHPSSSDRRRETALFIFFFGVVMPISCSRCKRLQLVCKTASKSESCGQCVSAGYARCNVHGNDPSRLRAVLAEKQRFDQEERDTLAKLLRLKDQQKRLAHRRMSSLAMRSTSFRRKSVPLLIFWQRGP
ncbi:hypothetical protein V8F06_013993 [Rhypophila decipiens]